MKFPALNSTLMLSLTLLLALFAAIMATLAFFVHPTDSDEQRALTSMGIHEDDALFISHGRDVALTSARTVNFTVDTSPLFLTIPYKLSAGHEDATKFDLSVKNLVLTFTVPMTGVDDGSPRLPTLFDENDAPIAPFLTSAGLRPRETSFKVELKLGDTYSEVSAQHVSFWDGDFSRIRVRMAGMWAHGLTVDGTGSIPLYGRIVAVATGQYHTQVGADLFTYTNVKNGTFDIDVKDPKSIICVGTPSTW